MKDSNVLIAEFMGMKPHHQDSWCLIRVDDNGSNEVVPIEELAYHTEWNWLMPVVEEIHTHGCEVVISSNGVTTIYAPSGEVLAEESSEEENHMHDATYKAIVKVLKENLHKPCE